MRDALPPLFCPLQPLFSPPVASIFADVHFHTFAATAAICAVFALCRFPLLFTLCRSVLCRLFTFYPLPFRPLSPLYFLPFAVPFRSLPFPYFRPLLFSVPTFAASYFRPFVPPPKFAVFFCLFNHLQRRKLCGEICNNYTPKKML